MDLDFPLRGKDIRDIRVSGIARSTTDTASLTASLRTSLFFPVARSSSCCFPRDPPFFLSPWPSSTRPRQNLAREKGPPMIARKTQRGLVNGVKRRQNVKVENRSPGREETWAYGVAAIPSLLFLVSLVSSISSYFFLHRVCPLLLFLFLSVRVSASGIGHCTLPCFSCT